MIVPDGIAAAALQEAELHPKTAKGKPITAWNRRRDTLIGAIAEVNRLSKELSKLKEDLSSRPF